MPPASRVNSRNQYAPVFCGGVYHSTWSTAGKHGLPLLFRILLLLVTKSRGLGGRRRCPSTSSRSAQAVPSFWLPPNEPSLRRPVSHGLRSSSFSSRLSPVSQRVSRQLPHWLHSCRPTEPAERPPSSPWFHPRRACGRAWPAVSQETPPERHSSAAVLDHALRGLVWPPRKLSSSFHIRHHPSPLPVPPPVVECVRRWRWRFGSVTGSVRWWTLRRELWQFLISVNPMQRGFCHRGDLLLGERFPSVT